MTEQQQGLPAQTTAAVDASNPNVKPAVNADDPLEKAKSQGYVEPEPPSREDRIKTVIADMQHAMASNAPMSPAMLAEIKDLLGHEDAPAAAEKTEAAPNAEHA